VSNFNTAIRYAAGAHKNPQLVDLSDKYCAADNAEFFAAVARELRTVNARKSEASFDARGVASLVLLGEYGIPAYRIRRAQEVIRVDRTPSLWSHAALLLEPLSTDAERNRDPARSTLLLESTWAPSPEFDHFAYRTGVSCRRLSDYTAAQFSLTTAHSTPNVAVIHIALTAEERAAVLTRAQNPESDQLAYDLLGQLGAWFAYIVSRGALINPLAQGVGLFNASYLQLAYDAAGVNLAPGAQQRNLAPEHIWQAARFLHESFRLLDDKGETRPRAIGGYYCVRDRACVIAPVELEVELPRTLGELLARRSGPQPSGDAPRKPQRKRSRRA
jgi:hypothetical protein